MVWSVPVLQQQHGDNFVVRAERGADLVLLHHNVHTLSYLALERTEIAPSVRGMENTALLCRRCERSTSFIWVNHHQEWNV